MSKSTSFNLMNELNEADTNAYKLNKKVIIESDKVVTKKVTESADNDTVGTFYADLTFDATNEDDLLNQVNEWLGPIANQVKVSDLKLRGQGGWPSVKLTGNKEVIANKLVKSGFGDTIQEVMDTFLLKSKKVTSESEQVCPECGKELDKCTCNKKELKEDTSATPNYDKLENAIEEGLITKDQIADELMQSLSDDDLAYYLSNIFDFGDEDLEESEKEELQDAKETLADPKAKGEEKAEAEHDVARLSNKEDLTEANNKNKIEEAEVKNLQEVKSQGNIYMLKDDNKYMVGENYNESEGILENAEIYESKDEADKDYLSRCDIKKDNKETDLE